MRIYAYTRDCAALRIVVQVLAVPGPRPATVRIKLAGSHLALAAINASTDRRCHRAAGLLAEASCGAWQHGIVGGCWQSAAVLLSDIEPLLGLFCCMIMSITMLFQCNISNLWLCMPSGRPDTESAATGPSLLEASLHTKCSICVKSYTSPHTHTSHLTLQDTCQTLSAPDLSTYKCLQ
jgi:hypothetical protein